MSVGSRSPRGICRSWTTWQTPGGCVISPKPGCNRLLPCPQMAVSGDRHDIRSGSRRGLVSWLAQDAHRIACPRSCLAAADCLYALAPRYTRRRSATGDGRKPAANACRPSWPSCFMLWYALIVLSHVCECSVLVGATVRSVRRPSCASGLADGIAAVKRLLASLVVVWQANGSPAATGASPKVLGGLQGLLIDARASDIVHGKRRNDCACLLADAVSMRERGQHLHSFAKA